jgi:hypothetical protein
VEVDGMSSTNRRQDAHTTHILDNIALSHWHRKWDCFAIATVCQSVVVVVVAVEEVGRASRLLHTRDYRSTADQTDVLYSFDNPIAC